MTATTGKQFSVGLRYLTAFALNANGRPAATSASSPYAGIQAAGAKTFNLTPPDPRQIAHSGDDRLLARDVLPPLEGATAEVMVAKNDYTLFSLLTGTLVQTIGEATALLWSTDQQGFEPVVGLMAYQQSLDASVGGVDGGARRWRTIWIPKGKAIPKPSGMSEAAAEFPFSVTPYIVTAHLWGQAFSLVNNGATEAQFAEMMMTGKPWLDSWLGDNTTTVFTLSKTALTTAKISVFVDGTLKVISSDYTATTTAVTFLAAPALNADVNILYEW